MTPAIGAGQHTMTTFVLLHGSGDGGWAWHLVQRALHDLGHDAVAPDLPTDREDTTWADVVSTAATAAGNADDLVVVGHSAGGFAGPLVAGRLDARLLVHLAGLVPRPGERPVDWFDHVGWTATTDGDPAATFFHDVDPALAAESAARERPTSERLGIEPWPGPAWPGDRSRYVVTARDRFLPPDLQRRVAADRLAITAPDELPCGHCAPLSRPVEVAALLARYAEG